VTEEPELYLYLNEDNQYFNLNTLTWGSREDATAFYDAGLPEHQFNVLFNSDKSWVTLKPDGQGTYAEIRHLDELSSKVLEATGMDANVLSHSPDHMAAIAQFSFDHPEYTHLIKPTSVYQDANWLRALPKSIVKDYKVFQSTIAEEDERRRKQLMEELEARHITGHLELHDFFFLKGTDAVMARLSRNDIISVAKLRRELIEAGYTEEYIRSVTDGSLKARIGR